MALWLSGMSTGCVIILTTLWFDGRLNFTGRIALIMHIVSALLALWAREDVKRRQARRDEADATIRLIKEALQ